MADYITLLGAEQVQSAASTIRGAGEMISSAASTIDDAARRMRETMDEATTAMNRLAEALEASNAREAAKAGQVVRCGHDDAECLTPKMCWPRGACERRPLTPWSTINRPKGGDPEVKHSPSCGYPRTGCTCRAWETSPLG